MTNPKKTLEEIFCFLLEVETIEGLNIQRRIDEVCDLGHSATVTYNQKVEVSKEKTNQILFNRSIKSYTPEQKEFVNSNLKDFMHIFNYCDQGQDNNLTDNWHQEQQ